MVPVVRSRAARFCARCGTPLFYDMPDADFINITLGSLDEPELIKPEAQSNLDSKMHWFGDLDGLPVEPEAASDENRLPVNNRQHRIVTRPNGHLKESKT